MSTQMRRPGRRPHVVYVTAGMPYPLTSGYLRHHHFLRHLAADHDITLLSLCGADTTPGHVAALSPVATRVVTFPTSGKERGLRRVAAHVRSFRPSGTRREPAVRALCDEISAIRRRQRVDAVFLSGKRTAPALDVIGGLPLVVDICDATSSRLRLEARLTGGVHGIDLRVQHAAMRLTERRLLATSSEKLVASMRDRELMARHDRHAAQATVVPNGVDPAIWTRSSSTLGGAVVLCGNLGYRPNADAVRRLVLDVMPRVWARRPGTEVVLVGTGAPPSLLADVARPEVTVTGPVDDVKPHLERGAVFAAPLRAAAGVQNKLLEAMAMAVPVVTSSVAAAGLRTPDGEPPVTVADSVDEQAAGILDRLAAAALDPVPDWQARVWVTERFRWDESAAKVVRALRQAIDREGARC